MANRYASPVLFAMEKNVVFVSARVVFNPSGIAVLDTSNSKGVCNFQLDQVAFTANTVGSSTTMSSVSSFAGLFNGMTVTGFGATTTISSITAGAAQSLTLASGTGVTTTNAGAVIATGGRYRIQFGTQAAQRLDTYNKLLGWSFQWEMTTSSAVGTATRQHLAPAAPEVFLVQNNIQQRTIPKTSTSGSTDASLVIQTGTYGLVGGAYAGGFTAQAPATGESLKLMFMFGNSTAL